MKYGVLCAKQTRNIGDDIQSYAQLRFLPTVDYMVEREQISNFKSDNNEPVAVIMNAWWMWRKWNWPPAKSIIPLLTSIHMTEWTTENWGSSIKFEILEGLGRDYLNSYGPVGCRDKYTLDLMKKYKIKAYLSGCVTLTLPKMKKTKDNGKYICAVDVSEMVVEQLKNQIAHTNLELKISTHDLTEENESLTWEERMNNVEKVLTKYQNAKCVITSRLHVALPCLAMEVPVLLVRNDPECNRFDPYIDLLHFMTEEQFLKGKYDIENPLKNREDYITYRKSLIKEIENFVEKTKKYDSNNSKDLIKVKYSDDEVKKWQYNLMSEALEKWFYRSREMLAEYNKTIDYLRKIEKENYELKNSTSWKITKPIRLIKENIDKIVK